MSEPSAADIATVLVVDDDPGAQLLARSALEIAGFRVVCAGDGLAGLAAFRAHSPDCIVLDVVMPGMNGFAMCEQVRSAPGGQHVPVLMMTSLDDMDSVARAYNAGATDFASKGVNPMLLAQRVKFLVRTKQTWTYGRFEIRAKLPVAPGTSKGLWPGFWLRPAAGGTGELDILEAIGSTGAGNTSDEIHQTIWYDYVGTHPKETYTAVTGFDASAGWHTYAAEWEPGVIRWYVDGKLTFTRSTSTTTWLTSAFSKPFFVRLNLSVGGSWPGSPDAATAFPADYSIDYLRVYQR